MELRSNRGATSTPFSHVYEKEFIGEGEQSVVRSTKSTTVRSTTTKSDFTDGNDVMEGYKPLKQRAKSDKIVRKTRYKTSDYSSEDNEQEVVNPILDNVRNQGFDHTRRSVSVSSSTSHVSALDVYRAAGEYWNKYPKTDYTYSPHSRDRIEIAPGVVAMPNMSRRSLHKFTGTDQLSAYQEENGDQYDGNYESTITSSRFEGSLYRNNNYKYKNYSSASTNKGFLYVFTWIYSMITTILLFGYGTQNSLFVWLGKQIHNAAGRIMLFDTWLLRSSTQKKKAKSLLVLCLLPLVAFGGWWLLSGLDSNRSETTIQQKNQLTRVQLEEIAGIIRNSLASNKMEDLQYKSDGILIGNLQKEVEMLKLQWETSEADRTKQENKIISMLRTENEENSLRILQELKTCCKSFHEIEQYVLQAMKNQFGANREDFLKLFTTQEELEDRLNKITLNLRNEYDSMIKNNAKSIMDEISVKILSELKGNLKVDTLSDEAIRKIVQESLKIYDADKTGLVDYALESSGGEVVNTRCTKTYEAGTAVLSFLGIPLWYPTNTPRTVISPGIAPGQCWAFKDFPGFLVIKLSRPIRIEAFSLEHISKLLVPEGRIDSAPKSFSVHGLRDVTDKEPIELGNYVYDYDGEPLQYFAANVSGLFELIELRVHSNHGNPHYTCLYRLRVHGKPNSSEPT